MSRLSVVIATYNGEKFINDQLSSIIKQLDEDSEVIISDNGSTDRTIEIINSFNDRRITILHCLQKGSVHNFENALNRVSGDIIFLADQDDVWLDNKVQIVKEYLRKYDLIMADSRIVDENLNVLHESFYVIKNAGNGFLKNVISNTYQGCSMAFKKEVLNLSLPFPNNIPMHDIWIGFVAELFFSTCFIPEKLLLHRRHHTNASTSTNKSEYNFYQKLTFRFQVLKYLPLLLKRKYFPGKLSTLEQK
ncbi:glycosyltransferase family 2 protein [Parafilimonas sp.]|uniref:glycosyltransferase family 2 protein n=1 Tax=Parafilimonas sp. TaxID=1969739 RepID=UPI003F8177A2